MRAKNAQLIVAVAMLFHIEEICFRTRAVAGIRRGSRLCAIGRQNHACEQAPYEGPTNVSGHERVSSWQAMGWWFWRDPEDQGTTARLAESH